MCIHMCVCVHLYLCVYTRSYTMIVYTEGVTYVMYIGITQDCQVRE